MELASGKSISRVLCPEIVITISDVDGLVAKVPPSNGHPRRQARVIPNADDEVIESTMTTSFGKKTRSTSRRKLR